MAQDFALEDVQMTVYHLAEKILAVVAPCLETHQPATVQAEECLRQLIVYLGYLCLEQPRTQQRLSYGRPPTVLMRLCTLPMRFFTHATDKAVLLPTLIAIAYKDHDNKRILHSEVSPALLVGYLERHLTALEQATRSGQQIPQETRILSLRLPAGMWPEMIEYLRQPNPDNLEK